MNGTTLLVTWQMLLILLPLHSELEMMLAFPTAMLLLLLSYSPAGSLLLLSNPVAGETAAIPPLTTTSPAATLPKTTNGKRMGVAWRRRRRQRHVWVFQLVHFAVGIQCANGIHVRMVYSTDGRVMSDGEREERLSTS